ncbi:UDP-glucuronosyltransferase 2B20-like [Asterias amurensis]|uniref:UDP-glucuronosyltransferase 2B20-like n=1 Tax=Asterias amurensis TaxID=7602 RepID=UPI003AB83E1F
MFGKNSQLFFTMANSNQKHLQFAIVLVFIVVYANTMATVRSPKKLKFLFYTASDEGSHHLMAKQIATALVRSGHDVTFLLSNSCTKWLNASDASLFDFTVHKSKFTENDRVENLRELSRASLRGDTSSIWRMVLHVWRKKLTSNESDMYTNFFATECESLLGDNDTINSLREKKFDMLVGEELSSCQPLLAKILGIKFSLISGIGSSPAKGMWYGLPSHPAYIPDRQSGLTDRMTFLQRLKSCFLYGVHMLARRQMLMKYRTIQEAYDLSPEKSMVDMMAEAQIWVFTVSFELDLARPLTPNVIFTASPLLGIPSEHKISEDLQEFLDGANEEGVVLFSLGGHVNEMESAQAQMFANALARLPQRVLWQFSGNISRIRIGNNIKTVKWMPQQEVMDHPNTKMFLSHGGLNGVHEAAWYGLPVVGIPLFGDQFDNMERAEAKGMAIKLDILTLNEDVLVEAITRVIKEPRFRERAQHISRMLRDQLLIPSEKAAFWISHVTKYGGEHLRPRSANLTWIQNNLIDVYAFLGAILLVVSGLLFLVCRVCFVVLRDMCKRREKLKIT